jgi:Na+/H+-dicarboxylate symporter
MSEQPIPQVEKANEDGDAEESKGRVGCCGIFVSYPITAILVFVLVGVGIGVGLSYWEPENADNKKVLIQWIGLAGDLFIRALKCFVLPLVFVNIIIAVVDMMSIGKATSIGWTVIALYLITTVAAAFFGSMSTLIFMRFYNTEEDDGEDASEKVMAAVSLSDTIYEGIFEKIVPNNIVDAFASNEFTAVMFFAVVFGAALSPEIGRDGSKLMGILQEMDNVFQRVIRWIIFLTPFAVLSLIASSIGKQSDLGPMFSNIGLLMASSFLAWGLQVVFIYIGLFTLLTKSNPFEYLKHIIPAQLFAFASASSAATIPTSLEAVRSTGKVPDVIGRFVVPFGATVNMDGGAVYFVCACIWLAVLNGEEVTAASFFLLIIIATMGSIGTAPVPSASLVLIITAYNTVFGGTGTPNGFGYIFAIDWFMDRMRTVTNVTGDCIVTGIVAHRCPIDEPELTAIGGSKDKQIGEEGSVDIEG